MIKLEDILILEDSDFYLAPIGNGIKSNRKREMYNKNLVIHKNSNGDIKIIKNRWDISMEDVLKIINFDKRILLII